MINLPQPQAILLDWDNTLVDTWPCIGKAANITLEAMGHDPWTEAEIRERIAGSLRDTFPRIYGERWEEARDKNDVTQSKIEVQLHKKIISNKESHEYTIVHTDAFRLVAEVIESKTKPSAPWGQIARTAFGAQALRPDTGDVHQALLALGRQDVDPDGLVSLAAGQIIGASSDHLVLAQGQTILAVGDEVTFELVLSRGTQDTP